MEAMVIATPVTSEQELHREPYKFSREDYDAMIQAGILDENDRVELIAGEILTKMSIGRLHAAKVNLLNRLLSAVAGNSIIVAVQSPIALDQFSEPEPDLALLKYRSDFYDKSLPTVTDIHLLIEVADSSLRFDRERKMPLYAAAGIPEVWLVDLVGKCLIRYRNPARGVYAEISRHAPGESIPIPSLPDAQLALADLAL
jgi:Uma2 family endonuclease